MDKLLNSLYSFPDWGYAIYRTTYSAESDAAFPDAVRYIEACIKLSFFEDCNHNSKEYANEVWAKYRSTIIEDPTQFNGTSLEEIRAHFEAWVDAQGKLNSWNKFRICIIVDEESIQTLRGISAEDLENENPVELDEELRCVKVLEAFPIVDELDTFPGWMRCWTWALWDLWAMMEDGDGMGKLFKYIDDYPFEGLYCG